MASHTAKSLFALNIVGTDECLALYDGLQRIQVRADIDWLLRASIVFSVSALDAYFHDKVRYRVGHFRIDNLPTALARVPIKLGDLTTWESHKRKGNAIRNWVVSQWSYRPLQNKEQISEAMRLCGVEAFWEKAFPASTKRAEMLTELKKYADRRNDIVHEGDRMSARNSGKQLRPIDRSYAKDCRDFVSELVDAAEVVCDWG